MTETAIDDDYELIHVQPSRSHHDLATGEARALSPMVGHVASRHPSRHGSPAASDSSRSSRHHHQAPVETRPGAPHRAHKPPPPPPPRRRIHVDEDIPTAPAAPLFDPFDTLPPPDEMMIPREGPDDEEDDDVPPIPRPDQLHFYDDEEDTSPAHQYWPASKPTDL